MPIKVIRNNFLLAGMLSLVTTTVHATENPWILGLNYDAGGDDIVTVIYNDGSTSTLSANEGIHFYIGKSFANGVGSR